MKNNNIENTRTLKLNVKNTLYIGCAFFAILMLWQMYNNYCPLFLDYLIRKHSANHESNEFLIGIIMAGDNGLAIFMLPLFGSLSDKTNTKFGKRMPYIVVGMLLSAILFPLIAVMFYIESLVGTIVMMAVILIIMNMYRNPAVALMPDVTPKPLRSKANGLINFVGYLGAIIAGALALFLKIAKDSKVGANWEPTNKANAIIAFCIASFFMLLAMFILIFKIKENKLVEENKEDIEYGEKISETLNEVVDDKPLSKEDKKNFFILLAGILFWFMSFNAIETFNSLFCKNILQDEGIGSTIVIVMTVSSIITFLAAANLPAKIGRKNSVLIGIGALVLSFLGILLYFYFCGVFKESYATEIALAIRKTPNPIPVYLLIAVAGAGWALINANSYPMMVEMSSQKTIGKFTGYYYTTSMIAQTVTPILVGLIMYFSDASLKLLYVYSGILMLCAFVVMFFFKENKNNRKSIKKGLDALDID